MPVQGIGGLFFRAKDPDALAAWYKKHLGVGAAEADGWVWQTQGGPVVFAPFKSDTDYFAADKEFMINFRVTELDHMLEKLTKSGISVITKPEWNQPETGRFARIHDPEGNAIELWEEPEQ